MCHACHQTFSPTPGTVFSRLRTAADPVITIVTLLAHGCPVQALVAALGCDARTVAAWWARAGHQGQALHASLGEPPRDVGQVPADALCLKTQGGFVWMALAMMVQMRLGLGGEGSAQRDLPLRRRLIERGRRWAAPRPLLVCTDGLGSSIRVVPETLRDPVHPGKGGRPRLRPWRNLWLAQVIKRYARHRVGATERRRGAGT